LFEVHPALGVEGRAAVLDLDLIKMQRLDKWERRFQALRRFPPSNFDVTVDTELRTPAGLIEQGLVKAAGTDLVEIRFLGEYTGPPLREGQKSVSYRLIVGAADHTLTSEEVRAIDDRVKLAIRTYVLGLRV
jgi:phenylalanyl-tRNA synthetase beta chain